MQGLDPIHILSSELENEQSQREGSAVRQALTGTGVKMSESWQVGWGVGRGAGGGGGGEGMGNVGGQGPIQLGPFCSQP